MGKEIEVAILFADVVGSTKLYELLGDLRARDMVGICIEVMRAATEQNHGTVIKTMGDEVMATFPTADDALNAAAQMQKLIALHPQLKVDEQTVAIRIGCNFGPVVLENRDIFGSAVHTANRMTSQAKAGQIMTTATMVEHLSTEWHANVRQIDIATLKGAAAKWRCSRCYGRPRTSPAWCLPSPSPRANAKKRANHRPCACATKVRRCGERRTRANITIGRAEENDLVVKGNLISRLHARVNQSQ